MAGAVFQEHQLICSSNRADYGDRPSFSPSSAVISCGLSRSLRNYIPSSNPDVPICAKNTFTTEAKYDGGNDNDVHDKKMVRDEKPSRLERHPRLAYAGQ